MSNNDSLELMKQFIWAYPQVMADSIVIDAAQLPNTFYVGNMPYTAITDDTPYPPEIYL